MKRIGFLQYLPVDKKHMTSKRKIWIACFGEDFIFKIKDYLRARQRISKYLHEPLILIRPTVSATLLSSSQLRLLQRQSLSAVLTLLPERFLDSTRNQKQFTYSTKPLRALGCLLTLYEVGRCKGIKMAATYLQLPFKVPILLL